MLASALKKGGKPISADEEKEAERIVANLTENYHAMNGVSDYHPCASASDFDILITAKYQ